MALPSKLVDAALDSFTSFSDCLEVILKQGGSAAGQGIEFLGATASVPESDRKNHSQALVGT